MRPNAPWAAMFRAPCPSHKFQIIEKATAAL
jgi:hypothetical protein